MNTLIHISIEAAAAPERDVDGRWTCIVIDCQVVVLNFHGFIEIKWQFNWKTQSRHPFYVQSTLFTPSERSNKSLCIDVCCVSNLCRVVMLIPLAVTYCSDGLGRPFSESRVSYSSKLKSSRRRNNRSETASFSKQPGCLPSQPPSSFPVYSTNQSVPS
ncbi:hypothetical protein CBL_11431 [Carabus blaptoides fortunei]